MCSIVGVFGVFGLLLSGICVVIALFTLAVVWGARLITPLSVQCARVWDGSRGGGYIKQVITLLRSLVGWTADEKH